MQKGFSEFESHADTVGTVLVKVFHLLALFAIGGATVWSAVVAFFGMVKAGHAGVGDILLLFIYLELGAMVGIYFKTSRMPVRFLIYVAITALTRMMIEVLNVEHVANMTVILLSGAILLLAFAELILRYGSTKLPVPTSIEEIADFPMSGELEHARRASSRRQSRR
ncbi:MAG: phosphate-starvation-inducible PsiE family protein [Pseudomonadota bacterium]|nr:phosphate-starvation-inducible PsiE family protein [Pseudomonadota bacterium]